MSRAKGQRMRKHKNKAIRVEVSGTQEEIERFFGAMPHGFQARKITVSCENTQVQASRRRAENAVLAAGAFAAFIGEVLAHHKGNTCGRK